MPFYREFVNKSAFADSSLNGIVDLRRFPILTKPKVQALGRDLMAEGLPKHLQKLEGQPRLLVRQGNPVMILHSADSQLMFWFLVQDDANSIEDQVLWLERNRPDYILGQSANIDHLALACQDRTIDENLKGFRLFPSN